LARVLLGTVTSLARRPAMTRFATAIRLLDVAVVALIFTALT
jgi:hypothetical protein